MSEFVKLAAGAFFGVFVGLLVGWWKSHRDELRSLCDECCKTITEAAEAASAYWLTSSGDEKNTINEARLLGLQVRLDGYRVMVVGLLERHQREKLNYAFAEFYDALTGGEFKTSKRSIDNARAHAAQVKASIAILAVRNGFYRTVSLRRTLGLVRK